MVFIRKQNERPKTFKMTVQENLIKLYENRGDEHLLSMTYNHKVILRAIIDHKFNGIMHNGFRVNNMNQKLVYDLLSWGMIDYQTKKYGKIMQGHAIRRGQVGKEIDEDTCREIMGIEEEFFVPTNYGLAIYNYLNLNNKKNQSGHNNIIYDFIKFRESMGCFVFEDMEIKTQYGVSRPDVFTVDKTLNEDNMKPTTYEIKHSRADFLSDMKKPDKWKSYLEVSEKLYYVCPEGVIKKEDLPKECGLIYQLADKSFKTIKNAKKGKGKMTLAVMMKMMLKMESNGNIILLKPCFDKRNIDGIFK